MFREIEHLLPINVPVSLRERERERGREGSWNSKNPKSKTQWRGTNRGQPGPLLAQLGHLLAQPGITTRTDVLRQGEVGVLRCGWSPSTKF